MFFNKTYAKKQRKTQKYFFSISIICLIFFFASHSANSEESPKNNLPQVPNTGSPEEDFSAGGSRDKYRFTQICGEKGQKIAYLLGNKNREFTVSAYPTFWFYIFNNTKQLKQIKFILTELETGNKIYDRVIQVSEIEGTIGISIPAEPQYALSTNVNYSWSLAVDCIESSDEPTIALEGWLSRLPLNPDLQNQLAAASDKDKYKIYLANDLLYDALNALAQSRIAEPNNTEFKIAWNQLLLELGW